MAAQVSKIALLGSGTVGQAVLRRLASWQGTPLGRKLRLVYAANTRLALQNPEGLDPLRCGLVLGQAPRRQCVETRDPISALGCGGILIDATADAGTAARHAECLLAGVHVVTACKLAAGTSLHQWEAIQLASEQTRAGFGDRATVGAGLPLLRSIRELQAGGDKIRAIAGVMSGSLAWLFDAYDGSRKFSELVCEARNAGFTEPDPREDLSGEDVRRKLLILARAAGFAIESNDVEVRSLVSGELGALPLCEVSGKLHLIDEGINRQFSLANAEGKKLKFVARLENGVATVGLERLEPNDPLSGGGGTDNRVAIWSDRYLQHPLIIQGPGAEADITAAALLDDVLALRSGALPIGRAA